MTKSGVSFASPVCTLFSSHRLYISSRVNIQTVLILRPLSITSNTMADWNCDICSISMHINNKDSHLAGRGHATCAKEILPAAIPTCAGKRQDFKRPYLNQPAEARNAMGEDRLLSPKSTPTIRHKQNTKSSPLGTGSTRAATHNSAMERSKTRERGTQTRSEPATENHTVPPAQSVPSATFTTFEFTVEEIAKPVDFFSSYGSSYVLVWECKSCNRWMPLSSKAEHLVSTGHTGSLLQSFTISSLVFTQYQSSTVLQAPMYDTNVTQASNRIMPSPQLSNPTLVQGNTIRSQSSVPETKISRTSKSRSAKPASNSDASEGLASKKKEYKTIASSSRAVSTSQYTPRFWTCPHCRAVLAIHQKDAHMCLRAGPSIEAPNVGALDFFFRSFPSFPYNAQKSPAVSFEELLSGLGHWNNWDEENPSSWGLYRKEVKEKYQAALTREFNLWFGTKDRIESWHALCRAVRIHPPPPTCEGCRSVSQKSKDGSID